MEQDTTTTLTGSSGKQYRFDIHPRSTTFRAKPGVYVMARHKEGHVYEFCFVGETDDLSKRPFNPEKQACFNRFGVTSIFLIEEFDADRRSQVVQDLVSAYLPHCNAP
jgi:hypothetical protein